LARKARWELLGGVLVLAGAVGGFLVLKPLSAEGQAWALAAKLEEADLGSCGAPTMDESGVASITCSLGDTSDYVIFVYPSQNEADAARADLAESNSPEGALQIEGFQSGRIDGDTWSLLLISDASKDAATEIAEALGGTVSVLPTARIDDAAFKECFELLDPVARLLGGDPTYSLGALGSDYEPGTFEYETVVDLWRSHLVVMRTEGSDVAMTSVTNELAKICQARASGDSPDLLGEDTKKPPRPKPVTVSGPAPSFASSQEIVEMLVDAGVCEEPGGDEGVDYCSTSEGSYVTAVKKDGPKGIAEFVRNVSGQPPDGTPDVAVLGRDWIVIIEGEELAREVQSALGGGDVRCLVDC
jgi:hypothetical protein